MDNSTRGQLGPIADNSARTYRTTRPEDAIILNACLKSKIIVIYWLFEVIFFILISSGVIKSLDHMKYTLIKFKKNMTFSSTVNIKHDKKCKEYLTVQDELSATGRVVRFVRAELSATGRAVHGPSCPGIVPVMGRSKRTRGLKRKKRDLTHSYDRHPYTKRKFLKSIHNTNPLPKPSITQRLQTD